jgi:hypothetical protein
VVIVAKGNSSRQEKRDPALLGMTEWGVGRRSDEARTCGHGVQQCWTPTKNGSGRPHSIKEETEA